MRDIRIGYRKVAFVATVFRHLEAFHLPYIQWLQQSGCEVHAYGKADNGLPGVLETGANCHTMSFERSPFSIKNLRVFMDLVRSFRKEEFDMVHVHTPMGSVLGRIAAKMAGVPNVLYTAHGFHFFSGSPLINWLLYYPVERFLSRWTHHLITINSEDFSRAQQFPVQKECWFVAGVGVDEDVYTSQFGNQSGEVIRKELSIAGNDFVILCVAEFTKNKNQIQLIEAVGNLVQRFPNIHCLLVGNGAHEQYLREVVRKKGLDSQIKFLGFRRDVPSLLRASDVVTLMSKREGLPKALLEAMTAGKPIVATNARGNRDLVTHGKNGFLVPISDIQATSDAFEVLLTNPSLRRQMGQHSLELSRPYHLQSVMEHMTNIYQTVLGLQATSYLE